MIARTAARLAVFTSALLVSIPLHSQTAEQAARSSAEGSGARLTGFAVSADGQTVEVTVEKTAHTLFLQRFASTRSWTVARTTRRTPVPK